MSQRLTAAEFQAMHGSRQSARKAMPGELGTRLPKLPQPNKLEAEWMHLCASERPLHVLYEPFTLRLPDGTKYTSSVRFGSVSRIRPGQPAEVIASGIPSAASMCYDSKQNQLVIPMNPNNALAFIKLDR